MTDTEKITSELNQRFAAPLPEFYARRIIFWYDEGREFEDCVGDIELDDAKLLTLTEKNIFSVKKLLCADDTASNFVVYTSLSYDMPDDDWFLNVKLYSEEYRADVQSSWMDEMGIPAKAHTREQVKRYQKFFKSAEHRRKVAAFDGHLDTANEVSLAVMAVLCKNKGASFDGIVRAMLSAGLSDEENEIYKSFENYGVKNDFWSMVSKKTGYGDGGDPCLEKLAIHILLTAVTRTMPKEKLAGLDEYISTAHQAWCYDFISDWLHSDENGKLHEIAEDVETETGLRQRFSKIGTEDLEDTECFPCVNECILSAMMTEICDEIIQTNEIRSLVEKRRTLAWYDEVSCYYDGLFQMAEMQQFFVEHEAGFHTVEPEKIWKEYADDFYKMDTHYRKFQLSFQRSLKSSNMQLDDLFKQVADKAESLYSNWFLEQLGENWSDACAGQLREYGRVLDVPQQEDFYREMIKGADSRTYVIISDALRYEVGVELAEMLRRKMQCNVKIECREAIFPTATKYGMAALLPHEKLGIKQRKNGQLSVLADRSPTEAGDRDGILKSANKNSVALRHDDIIKMKRSERQELVRGMDVVYIYHNSIDEASHTSDSEVFPACSDAIDEILNLVRIIVNEFSGTHIIITADHGFLYTYRPLREDEKADLTTQDEHEVEAERRYVIAKCGTAPDYLLPVKFMGGDDGFEAYAPRESVRIKKKGGGLNFVHGGISLQEMAIPVIDYRHLRTDSHGYKSKRDEIDTRPVELSLLSSVRKVSNMVFSLEFFQKQAVGGNLVECTYLLYFVDSSDNKVSDTKKIIADRKNEDGKERTFKCSFNLRSLKFDSRDSYYLVIADEDGKQLPQKEEFQIDIAFAVEDFGF